MTKISKSGAVEYADIKGLDIYEFFLLVYNLEKQQKEQKNNE
jgi:hypothetical protein